MLLTGVAPGPASSPFCPPVVCTHSLPCPQMLGCDDKSVFAVTVEKIELLQSGSATLRLATVPPTLPPYAWPKSGAAHLQSLYLVFLWWVVRGRPPPTRRAARLCARTTGSLNALKSCSMLSTVRPDPPQPGAFGPSLHGDVVSCSRDSWPLHPPTARDGGAEGASWRPGDVTTRGGGGTQGYWKDPTAITEVSATRLPSRAS